MTHRRDPGSFADAVTRVIVNLGGDQACADATGIARAQLQAWKNPERDAWPNLEQAFALDGAWLNANPGQFPPPITEALLLRLHSLQAGDSEVRLVTDAMRINDDVGRLLAFALDQLRIGGPGATVTPSPEERHNLLESVSSAIKGLGRIQRALEDREEMRQEVVAFRLSRPETRDEAPAQEASSPPKSLLARLLKRQ